MELSPSQRFALNEMGIPVWELRSTEQQATENANEELAPALDIDVNLAALKQATCLVVMDGVTDLDQSSERLLHAMLRVMELPGTSVEHVSLQQFNLNRQQLFDTPKQQVLLLLGQAVAKQILNDSLDSAELYPKLFNLDSDGVKAVCCDDLATLLAQPENKFVSWKSLLLAKSYLKSGQPA